MGNAPKASRAILGRHEPVLCTFHPVEERACRRRQEVIANKPGTGPEHPRTISDGASPWAPT